MAVWHLGGLHLGGLGTLAVWEYGWLDPATLAHSLDALADREAAALERVLDRLIAIAVQ